MPEPAVPPEPAPPSGPAGGLHRGLREWGQRLMAYVAPEGGRAPRIHRRPVSLVYGLNDAVPASSLIPLAFQHAMLALTFLIYPVLAATEAGLSAQQTSSILSACALSMGLATLLQCARTRFGSGYLAVHIPAPGAIPLAVQAISLGGVGLMAATTFLVGFIQLGAARIVRPLRILLPPEVCGVAVTMLGVSLAGPALRRGLGMEGGELAPAENALLVSAATVCLIVAVTVFAPRKWKLFAVFLGASVGWALALALGAGPKGAADAIAAAPWMALPELHLPSLTLDPSLLPLVLLLVMMNLVDVLSVTVSLEKMNDADWHRADMRAAQRAVTACGIGNMLNGLTSGFQAGLSSSSVGLAFATQATARVIGLVAGALIFATAFFPKAIVALTLIPSPVIGGILTYTSAYLVVAGMDLITSRRLSERRVFVVGLSVLAGLSIILLPLRDQLPEALRPLFSTPLTVGACCAIALNLLFRIGISKESTLTLDPHSGAFPAMRNFLERQGDLWGARRDVIAQAIPVAAQALEIIADAGIAEGDVEVRARFDETHLDVEVLYEGEVMEAPKERPSPEALFGDAKEVAAFGAFMLKQLGEHVRFGRTGDRARIALRFDH